MVSSILGDYSPMLNIVLKKLNTLNLETDLICDHICYRVETEKRYFQLKLLLEKISSLSSESLVSGRLISIFKLIEPIKYKRLTIKSVELPAPKNTSKYKEGWEHAEFVVKDLALLITNNKEIEFKYQAFQRKINPELGLEITKDYQVKFHPLDILDVIEIEKEQGITEII